MIYPLARYERNETSQTGEDGVIAHILSLIGDGNKVAVEFGAADGQWYSNTYALEQRGWTRYLFDGDPRSSAKVRKCLLTVESINEEFDAAGVPDVIDVLSVDVDGNDFWLWKALRRPARVTLVEYNASLPSGEAFAIEYNPSHAWDGTNYFGASLYALYLLGRSKGLRLVHVTKLNAVFVVGEEAEQVGLAEASPHHTVQYYHSISTQDRPWVRVDGSSSPT